MVADSALDLDSPQPSNFEPGQPVRVIAGCLAGLTAEVVRSVDRERWRLKLGEGVYLDIRGELLELSLENLVAAS